MQTYFIYYVHCTSTGPFFNPKFKKTLKRQYWVQRVWGRNDFTFLRCQRWKRRAKRIRKRGKRRKEHKRWMFVDGPLLYSSKRCGYRVRCINLLLVISYPEIFSLAHSSSSLNRDFTREQQPRHFLIFSFPSS